MKNIIFIILFSLYTVISAKSSPSFIEIKNSYGYSSVLVLNDTLRIDTTGAGAYKKVVVDTSESIDVDRVASLVYSFRLWSNESDGDSITYIESIDCYDDGLDQWLSPSEYMENRELDSVYTFLGTTSTYAHQELRMLRCDKIRFIMSIPAAAGHSDTLYIPNRYLRLQD